MVFYYLKMAFLATLFTWGVTAVGAGIVFIFKNISKKIMSLMFGFGAGIMIAASFFSLILPAIEFCEELSQLSYLVVTSGVIFGGLLIFIIDLILPHMHIEKEEPEGIKTNISKKLLLVLAITLHNIPEGLAIGVAFGTVMHNIEGATIWSAWILAIGIGLQNFPEGMAVSVPLRSEGVSRKKAFFFGQASGMVEPISAIIGVVLVTFIKPILPFILGFAAGAMIYVVVEELIPSGKTSKSDKYGTIGVMLGFVIMMFLDLALG